MENEKHNITKALFDYGEQLVKKIYIYDQELGLEVKVLLNMLKENIPQGEINRTKIITSQSLNTKGRKAVPIVKSIFRANPDKEFSPPEIRDKLQEYKNRGELNSRSGSLLSTTHSAIRVLERQNFITKVLIPDSDPLYKFNEKEKGLI